MESWTEMALPPDLAILRGEMDAEALRGPELLHRLLEEGGFNHQPALLYRGQRMTFSEMNAAAARLARALVRRIANSRPNTDGDVLIAVGLPPSDRLVVTLLAIWKAGAAYLPLDAAFPAHRVQHILQEAQPVLVITDKLDEALWEGAAAASSSDLLDEASLLSRDPRNDQKGGDGDAISPGGDPLAIVLYTSGSTGVPKGVRIPHRAVLNRLRWQWREFPFGMEEETCVFKTALTFVDSVAELWGPLLLGRTVLVLDKEIAIDTERFVHALEDNRIARLVLVPSQLRAILLFLKMDAAQHVRATPLLSRLCFWVSSGEVLSVELAEQFFAHFSSLGLTHHHLCNFYGSTEVMGDVTYHVLRSSADLQGLERVPVGRPVRNTVVYVLDEFLRPALAHQPGEVFVAGRNVVAGYVARRDPHKFIPNPLATHQEYARLYRTGDFARVHHGLLEFEGRADSQVKVRGRRVDLSEVEAALQRIEGIDKAVVLCHRPGEEQQEVVAFVTLRDGYSVTGRLVEAGLRHSLPPYAVPHVLVVDRIPHLVNGKVDRQSLLRSYTESHMEPDYSGVPEGKVVAAHVLLNTVARVLGASARTRISLHHSFFELGGDSLNSVSTVSKLREQGFFISVRDFISSNTLGKALESMQPTEAGRPLFTEEVHHSKFHTEPLSQHHKQDVYSIITDSFIQKGDLELWITPPIAPSEYYDRMDMIWEELLEKNLSFVVTDSSGAVVGCALLFDAQDEPEVSIQNRLAIVFQFLGSLEYPIREQMLPHDLGQVLHSLMLSTSGRLSPRRNVLAVQFLEQEVLRVARAKGFSAVLTTNTSPLTQQLGRDVFGYQTLKDFQVNQYVAPDGSRPFEMAPDDQRVYVAWKPVE